MITVYFGEKGLTSTSANHVCNLAKEFATTLEQDIENISFIDSTVQCLSANQEATLNVGWKNFNGFKEKIQKIADCHQLEAWLREAIKEKIKGVTETRNMNVTEYCKMKNIECPIEPIKDNAPSSAELLLVLPEKTRVRYLQLQAEAAVIGKIVHKGTPFNKARKELVQSINKPSEVDGTGRDMVIYRYTPSLPLEEVDGVFFELQQRHREIQASINNILHSCEEESSKLANEAHEKYVKEYAEYSLKMKKIVEDYNQYIKTKSEEIGDLKIIIPEKLFSIYQEISKLGK